MAELLRALLARRDVRVALAAGALLLVVGFVWDGLSRGFAADRCAAALETAARDHDTGQLERTVKNPTIRARLAAAERVELAFVRPLSSEWARVGMLTRTATRSETIVLQLRADDAGCLFLRDYEAEARVR